MEWEWTDSEESIDLTTSDLSEISDHLSRAEPLKVLHLSNTVSIKALQQSSAPDARTIRILQLKALAYVRCGNSSKAREILEALKEAGYVDEETLGLLGSTWKNEARHALTNETKNAALENAYASYRQSYSVNHDYYTGINVAAIAVQLKQIDTAREIASSIRLSLEPLDPDSYSYWEIATYAEAQLIEGDTSKALESYQLSRQLVGTHWANLASTRTQALELAKALEINPEPISKALEAPATAILLMPSSTATSSEEATTTFGGPLRTWLRNNSIQIFHALGDVNICEMCKRLTDELEIEYHSILLEDDQKAADEERQNTFLSSSYYRCTQFAGKAIARAVEVGGEAHVIIPEVNEASSNDLSATLANNYLKAGRSIQVLPRNGDDIWKCRRNRGHFPELPFPSIKKRGPGYKENIITTILAIEPPSIPDSLSSQRYDYLRVMADCCSGADIPPFSRSTSPKRIYLFFKQLPGAGQWIHDLQQRIHASNSAEILSPLFEQTKFLFHTGLLQYALDPIINQFTLSGNVLADVDHIFDKTSSYSFVATESYISQMHWAGSDGRHSALIGNLYCRDRNITETIFSTHY